MLSKSVIRKEIRSLRDSLDTPSRVVAADKIRAQLVSVGAIRDARTWFIYVSCGSEVDTHELIRNLLSQGSVVTVPLVISQGAMIPRHVRSVDELRLGPLGFFEPPIGPAYEGAIDACVCPGLAFTGNGDRLGSGRGFYDHYLAAHPPRLIIGLAYECQIVAELPVEIHDRPMDFVITEKRIIHPARAPR